MSSTADKIEQEIKPLADVEKLRLVDAILADLDRPDPEIDRIWTEEARKRWDAYKAGRLRTVSYEEVRSQKSEVRGQRSEVRSHRSEVRGLLACKSRAY